MNSVPEIRREKVFIPPEMTTKEVKEKYGLSSKRAREVVKQGFFVKNYSKKQIIIDPENFDPAISYSTAKKSLLEKFCMETFSTEHQGGLDSGSGDENI